MENRHSNTSFSYNNGENVANRITEMFSQLKIHLNAFAPMGEFTQTPNRLARFKHTSLSHGRLRASSASRVNFQFQRLSRLDYRRIDMLSR